MSASNIDSTSNNLIHCQTANSALSLLIQRTKWLFLALCFYLISQGFTIPILALGPSWAIWPTLSDFATACLILMLLLNFQKTPAPSKASWSIFFVLIFICVGCILSFTWNLTWLSSQSAKGSSFGIFQIYRLFQFVCIFWVTAHIPLTTKRITVLRQIVNTILIFVCAGIILTYFSIVPLSTITGHLPQGAGIAGPWNSYASLERFGGRGWGTIGYNHAYVSAQVILLLSLKIHLNSKQKLLFFDNILLVLSIVACFLSESRAGLATMIFYAIFFWFQKPIYAIVAAVIAGTTATTAIFISSSSINLTSGEGSTVERQLALLNPNNSENLSGRDEIWTERMSLLDKEPLLWFFGGGFGSAIDSGSNAHMLYLHIIIETGLIGLLIFAFLFYKILSLLYEYEQGTKPVFWVTIALLFSSMTQETFYPTPAFGHFIGFYLCCLALALNSYRFGETSPQVAPN
ncbi:hypothetical protein C7Y66_14030 [Chroococcidiopsis sp. CCALA 051]|uniref:O-antigen ligase family protein n=1 Tax=Chroococcidiopsis sp. CCALA 051 TaxID=869949 RepID=UPI000D0CBD07|nr:O-antigen ligase family protein [Chroococcidiopsis sp. CCALA 051]MBE9015944.1 O-antigen ligase family protein [Chroococcidiopsidales cyanobacterium LEGE 13417]PSM48504.1 hypothetical protein C7Y66_14030 [Chroococcidiopsis sp. CCALA 051]